MPINDWIRRPAFLGLGASATLAAALAGCGGQPDSSTAVVVPPPNALATKAPESAAPVPATSTAGASGSTAGSAATSSAAPVKAEGWGTLKGQVIFGGDPPPQKTLVEQGKAEKNPDVCAKDGPIKAERLVVGDGKGVKNVLVYLPKPTAVNPEAKSGSRGGQAGVRSKRLCLRAPRVGVDGGRSGDPQVE